MPCGLASTPRCRLCEWEASSTRPDCAISRSCAQVMKKSCGTSILGLRRILVPAGASVQLVTTATTAG
ncbi:Uncharacterised protein [Bordetella pertussis]|nr:Uncharacterised protein [Bordetella pertussis]CFP59031.1 Uncharacterised protein [Bordetella pertussis]